MYIRRKVYSAIEDENGEIRYFSTNEIVNEEDYLEMLYSDAFLDDEDMERLFSDSDKKGLSAGAKAAIAAGTTAAAATALHFGAKGAAKKVAKGFEANAIERGLAKLHGVEESAAGKVKGVAKSGAAKVEAAANDLKGKSKGILSAKDAEAQLSELDAAGIKAYLKAGMISEKQANTLLGRLEKKAAKEAAAAEKKAEKTRKVVAKNKADLEKGGWRKRTGFRG